MVGDFRGGRCREKVHETPNIGTPGCQQDDGHARLGEPFESCTNAAGADRFCEVLDGGHQALYRSTDCGALTGRNGLEEGEGYADVVQLQFVASVSLPEGNKRRCGNEHESAVGFCRGGPALDGG